MAAPAFMSPKWAAAVEEAVQAGPPEEYRQSKLERYWQWVDLTGSDFTGAIALGVTEKAGGPPEGGRWLIVELDRGSCTGVRIVGDDEAASASFRLVGDRPTWQQVVDGYDLGKAMMYRRFRIHDTDPDAVLELFKRIYFVRETLTALARVPVRIPELAAA